MSYLDLQFQWYGNGITTVKPSGLICLRQFINATISPKAELLQAFKDIQEAAKAGDKKLKDQIKTEKLFFTTPSVIVDPIRNYDSVKSFLPFCVCEYDAIEYAAELRDYIFEKHKSCIFAYTSPSNTGAKFIFHIDTPTSIDDYKELFCGLAYDLDKFKGLDMSNMRVTQPLFISYDPNAKFREDAVPSVRRGYKVNSFVPFEGEIEIPENASEEDKQNCINMITHLIDRIEDSGHGQVVSSSFMASGLCAYYGIPTEEMWDLIEDRIRANAYLSKGTNGYLSTAKTMFNKGLNFPTALKPKHNDNRR